MSHEVQTFSEDLEIVQKLDDEPNDVDGLSADQLKAKFDLAGIRIQKFLNEVLIPSHNGLDKSVNERIDGVIEELKNVSEINVDNLGANNIMLDKKGETTLAEQYGLTSLVPNVHEALEVLSAWAKLKPETARLLGLPETAVLDDAVAAQNAAVGELDTVLRGLIGERAQIAHGSYTGTGGRTKTLTFPFEPNLVVLQSDSSGGDICVCVRGARKTAGDASYGGSNGDLALTWEENSLTIADAAYTHYNKINTTYYYTAIG